MSSDGVINDVFLRMEYCGCSLCFVVTIQIVDTVIQVLRKGGLVHVPVPDH